MSTVDRRQVEASIAALEGQRSALGDAVVDSSIVILREKLAALYDAATVAAEQAGERKLVTVLFADLSGFTALSEKSDPEQVRTLLNACFAALVPAIERYGGVVEKFIGDAIMVMFGAPVAHENDAERALRAALAMMDALADFNRRHGTTLGMHFGVNTGVVVAGALGVDGHRQYGVMGDTVNVAARLEDASESGQILVGAATHRHVAALFRFERCPPLRVKGKTEPLVAYRLLGAKSERRSARGIAGLRSTMVARDAELDTIVRAVRALDSATAGVLVVSGEAGLGKSRLLLEARSATQDIATWFEGRGLSHAEATSYGVVRDLLDDLVAVADDASPADVGVALRTFVDRYLPERSNEAFAYLARLRDVPVDADAEAILKDLLPQTLHSRMHAAFVDLVEAMSATTPVVLMWEDLHWIDASSMSLIEALAERCRLRPLLQVLTTRPHEERTSAWLGGLVSLLGERIRTISLEPLSSEDSALLLDKLLRIDGLPASTLRVILEKSEGNPFFLEELLRSLIDTGMLKLEGDRAIATQGILALEVPDTLQGVIAARIDCLAPIDKLTLQTASVIGRIFDRGVLGQTMRSEHPDRTPDRSLRALRQRELIRRRHAAEYIFKHAVTHEVAYRTLLIARRSALHRAVAQSLERLFPEEHNELTPTLAFHYRAGDMPLEAARHFMVAGDRAQATFANAEAIAFYEAAIEQAALADDEAIRTTGLESLGMVLGLIGRVDDAVSVYDEALACIGDEQRVTRARVLRRKGNAYNVQRRTAQIFAVYEEAAAVLGERTTESTAEWIDLQLDRMWACYWSARLQQLDGLIAEAGSVIEAHGSLAQKGRWFGSLALADFRRFRYFRLPDRTLEYARKHVEVAFASGNRRLYGRARTVLGFVHLWRDELEDAERFLLEGLVDVEAVGDVDTLFINLNYMALVGRKRCDVALTVLWAERTLAQALVSGNAFYRTTALGSLAWAHLQTREVIAAQARLDEAFAIVDETPSPIRFFAVGPALAIAVERKHWDAAIAHAQTLLQPSQQKMPDEIEALLREAAVAWDAGRSEVVGRLLEQAVEAMREQCLGYA